LVLSLASGHSKRSRVCLLRLVATVRASRIVFRAVPFWREVGGTNQLPTKFNGKICRSFTTTMADHSRRRNARKQHFFQKDCTYCSCSVITAVKLLMYAFGDDPNPAPESVSVLEDIMTEYINEMVRAFHPVACSQLHACSTLPSASL